MSSQNDREARRKAMSSDDDDDEREARREARRLKAYLDAGWDTSMLEWELTANIVLQKFACMLKGTHLFALSPFPLELCQHICKYEKGNKDFSKTTHASEYILVTLQERMAELKETHPECVHSEDPYMNVIHYFRALMGDEFLKKLMDKINANRKDKYLLNNVLPWLGLTDWNDTSRGRNLQTVTFKDKLTNFLKTESPSSYQESAAAPDAPLPLDINSDLWLRFVRDKLRDKQMSFPDGKRGGKRLHTRKLRMLRKRKSKSSKRKIMCKN